MSWQDTVKDLIDIMISRDYPESVMETVTGAIEFYPKKAGKIRDKIIICKNAKEAVKAVQPYLRAHLYGER